MKFSAWFTEQKRELPKPLGISQANEAILKRQRPVLALTYATSLRNGLTLLFFCSHDGGARRVRQTGIEIPRKRGRKDVRKIGAVQLGRRQKLANALVKGLFPGGGSIALLN